MTGILQQDVNVIETSRRVRPKPADKDGGMALHHRWPVFVLRLETDGPLAGWRKHSRSAILSADPVIAQCPEMTPAKTPPGLLLTEVDSVQGLATAIFAASFRGDLPPNRGRHFVTLVESSTGAWSLLTYVHFQPFGDTCLGGGACTDTAVLRKVSPALRECFRADGGPYAQLLRYALARMAKDFFAFFGHTSDGRATRIDLEVGFRRTTVEHLLIYTPSQLDDTLERALIAKIAAVGPF